LKCFDKFDFEEQKVYRISQSVVLLNRGTRDRFKASDFHANCDGIANTLCVIKSESGNIFG